MRCLGGAGVRRLVEEIAGMLSTGVESNWGLATQKLLKMGNRESGIFFKQMTAYES